MLLALAGAAPAPALGRSALGVSVVLLIAIAFFRRRDGWRLVLLWLVAGSIGALGIASAAHMADGDANDWSPRDLLGLDALGDAVPPDPAADIIAAFAATGADMISVRIDVANVAGAPSPTSTATQAATSTPTVTAPSTSTATAMSTSTSTATAVTTSTSTATATASVAPSATATALPADRSPA